MVITLTPSSLASSCHRLSGCVKAAGYEPTLLVGIKSGGAEVAREMRSDFPTAMYCEVRLSRPDTGKKNTGIVHRLLRSMPLWLCNLLRIAESRLREWASNNRQPQRVGDISLPEEIASQLGGATPKRILLIDDAIDTGATIQRAKEQLTRDYPDAEIKVAVITVTTAHPQCEADFCLYHNRTLCRFPWSNDYRP